MGKKMNLKVAENLFVDIIPDKEHEYLMTTAEVAIGYGVSKSTIWMHRKQHSDELIEGKHFFTRINKTESGRPPVTQLLFTKRGIIRLGFFVKSARAKLFRDWAEDLVLFVGEQAEKTDGLPVWPETGKRNHNRLTQERLIDILADVAQIDDKKLRVSIVNKLISHQ